MIGPKTTLTLERYSTPVSDSQGGATVSWYSVRAITGTLVTVDEREREFAGRIAADATHVFYIDYPIGITIQDKDRFRRLTRVFGIEGQKNKDQQNIRLRIFLKETV